MPQSKAEIAWAKIATDDDYDDDDDDDDDDDYDDDDYGDDEDYYDDDDYICYYFYYYLFYYLRFKELKMWIRSQTHISNPIHHHMFFDELSISSEFFLNLCFSFLRACMYR